MAEQGFGAAAQPGPPLLGPLASSVHTPSHWLYSRSHTRRRHSASGGRAPSFIGSTHRCRKRPTPPSAPA